MQKLAKYVSAYCMKLGCPAIDRRLRSSDPNEYICACARQCALFPLPALPRSVVLVLLEPGVLSGLLRCARLPLGACCAGTSNAGRPVQLSLVVKRREVPKPVNPIIAYARHPKLRSVFPATSRRVTTLGIISRSADLADPRTEVPV